MSARAAEAIRLLSPTPDQDSPAWRLARRLQLVLNATRRHSRRMEQEIGLGLTQLRALQCIQRRPGVKVGELARELGLHQSTVSNMLRQLTAQGWLETRRVGNDRRAVALYLSEGAALSVPVPSAVEEPLPEMLARLDPALLQRLDADLAQVHEALQQRLAED